MKICRACEGDGILMADANTPEPQRVTRDSRRCNYCRGTGYDTEPSLRPVRPTCPHCAKRPRTGSGDNVNPTCGNSACQEAEFRANNERAAPRKRRAR